MNPPRIRVQPHKHGTQSTTPSRTPSLLSSNGRHSLLPQTILWTEIHPPLLKGLCQRGLAHTLSSSLPIHQEHTPSQGTSAQTVPRFHINPQNRKRPVRNPRRLIKPLKTRMVHLIRWTIPEDSFMKLCTRLSRFTLLYVSS